MADKLMQLVFETFGHSTLQTNQPIKIQFNKSPESC